MSDSLASWVALHSVPGMGPVTFRRLLHRFGTVERVLGESGDETLGDVLRLQPSVRDGILRAKARLEWAERTVEALAAKGVRVTLSSDPDYPPRLRDLNDEPPVLYRFGEWQPQDAQAVGIVGTTRPSERGRDIARGLAARLARGGVTVVSGFAGGVDDASHLGALEAGGRTVACLPFGIRLFRQRPGWPSTRELAGRAVLLSEQPPDAEWETQAALNRNRLIAALSRALIIVETPGKGGALNTFEHACALGRPVFAVKFTKAAEPGRGNAIALGRGAQALERFSDVELVLEAVSRGPAQPADE